MPAVIRDPPVSAAVVPGGAAGLEAHAAGRLRDLRVPPGNRLQTLKGRWKNFHSIRINDQWRVVFRWEDGAAMDVQIVDYH